MENIYDEKSIYNESVPYRVWLKEDNPMTAFTGFLENFGQSHFYFRDAKSGMMIIVPYREVDWMFPYYKYSLDKPTNP